MTHLEINLLNTLYEFAMKKSWHGEIIELLRELGFVNSQAVRGILRSPEFQAVSTAQGTAIWCSPSDGKFRVVDTTAMKNIRPDYGTDHCRFCLIKEPVPAADLVSVGGDMVHVQCAKSHQRMRDSERHRAVCAARWENCDV